MEDEQSFPCFMEECGNDNFLGDILKWPCSENERNDEKKQVLILAHDKIRQEQNEYTKSSSIGSSSKKKKKKHSDDLDLTGSPLKASFNLDQTDLDEEDLETFRQQDGLARKRTQYYTPLTTREARKYVSEFRPTEKVGQVWAVCDGQKSGTLYLGKRQQGNQTSVQKVQLVTETFSSKEKDPFTLEQLIIDHNEVAPGASIDVENASCSRAIYNLCGSGGDYEIPSQLWLHVCWSGTPRTLFDLSLALNEVKLVSEIVPDQQWDEFTLLKSLESGIKNQGISWKSQNRTTEADDDDDDESESLVECLSSMLDRVKIRGPRASRQTDEIKEEEGECLLSSTVRQDVDLTDLCWEILQNVDSYKELCKALSFILKMIQQDEIRPYIYAKNQTRLALLVQKIVRGDSVDLSQELSGRKPLEILLEIGTEKLKRDHVHSILANFLATREELSPFINETSLETLAKLHYIKELTSVCQTYLSTNVEFLRSIVQQSIKLIEKETCLGDGSSHKFVLNVNGQHVKEQMTKLTPCVWQCHFRTSSKDISVSTSCHLSLEHPADHLQHQIKQENNEEDVDVTYYCTVVTDISRRLVL